MDHEYDEQVVPLAEPRALTPAERELLDFLLSGPVDSPELRAQAAGAMVAGACNCGCPSIQLAVREDAPRASLEGPVVRSTGWAEICAVGSVEEGLETRVARHIVGDLQKGEGVIWDLEIWPTSQYGPQQAVLPTISTLRFIA